MDIKIDDFRRLGIKIGNNCYIYSSLPTTRDRFLLTIGNNVTISRNVTFLLHDSSICVPSRKKYTDLLGEIRVGDNSFIGFGAIIMPGITIAPNTIVAAGSVLTKSIQQEGLIVGGNPAKIIGTIDSFLKKHYSNSFNLNGMSLEDIKQLVEEHQEKLIWKKTL